ncbi:double-cubane-cluster-containing anaerobic reductase [Marinisporobacter balticus]|uniref:Benzoyl-CoA reductase/2-hydroxyglutaryl-CoA dehydratase subunit BcrC/BadD/HgdB n=1 Tax=Marinisporobacter balticus TaxID=2018667 RepID=A0A4R2L2Q6_9FIRM|nr:double-cubane-cluster-containing anaerobic reductase [Marinisporobacter balticus]TCO76848.1 benzoyl-CoA reductase/2-hydroxyglutaryl-CoA dehydratase subunit BcrC/BadD/HgdB [Marinisporobacter balticus]
MEIRKDLPAIFEEFSEARRNGFIAANDFKKQNKPMIGTFCTFMPQEIPLAMGAATVSLCATSDETISEAEKELPRNLCPLIKSSYGFGKTDKCPYFYFSDMIIGETTCDGKKKMFELMGEFKPVHIMQLPNNPTTKESFAMWKNEIIQLKEVMEEQFNTKINEEDIRKAINLKNRERQALKDFYSLGKLNPPALSGEDILKVLYGSTFKFDREANINDINALTEKVKAEYAAGKKLESKPRILITGCPIGGVTEKVVKAIEENGAQVVFFENCMGAKAIEDMVDESNPDVYEALAEKYLKIGCSCMSPNLNRAKMLNKAIDAYQVDAVVDVILQACHTYAIETVNIKKFVNGEKELPYISIETDYSTSDIGQLNTRMAAFIEML